MKFLKKFITVLTLFSQCLSLADITSQKTNKTPKNSPSRLSFDYSYVNSNINHSETSLDSGFIPLNEDVNLMIHYFGIGHEYEIFSQSLFSFTGQLSIGFQSGEDVHTAEGNSGAIDFFEKALGHHGSAGLSLNWNSHSKLGKIQYFLGVRSTSSKTRYFLRYKDENSTRRSDEIQYDLLQTITESSIGFRSFIYADKNLYSVISINKLNFNIEEVTAQASTGEAKYSLSKMAEFKNQEYSIRIGFGFLY